MGKRPIIQDRQYAFIVHPNSENLPYRVSDLYRLKPVFEVLEHDSWGSSIFSSLTARLGWGLNHWTVEYADNVPDLIRLLRKYGDRGALKKLEWLKHAGELVGG